MTNIRSWFHLSWVLCFLICNGAFAEFDTQAYLFADHKELLSTEEIVALNSHKTSEAITRIKGTLNTFCEAKGFERLDEYSNLNFTCSKVQGEPSPSLREATAQAAALQIAINSMENSTRSCLSASSHTSAAPASHFATSPNDELSRLKAEIRSLKKPSGKDFDGDIEDAFYNSEFAYPSKTIYKHENFPNYFVKLDQPVKRSQVANQLATLVADFKINNVVVPKKELVYSPELVAPAVIVKKLPIENDIKRVAEFYRSLSKEEAANILFIVLKSRIKDVEDGSAFENLPNLVGTRNVAFIDTGAGTIDDDSSLISAAQSLLSAFSSETQSAFKKLTPGLLIELHSPADLLIK